MCFCLTNFMSTEGKASIFPRLIAKCGAGSYIINVMVFYWPLCNQYWHPVFQSDITAIGCNVPLEMD